MPSPFRSLLNPLHASQPIARLARLRHFQSPSTGSSRVLDRRRTPLLPPSSSPQPPQTYLLAPVQIASALQDRLQIWGQTPSIKSRLSVLGLNENQTKHLVDDFQQAAHRELLSYQDTSSHTLPDSWATDYLQDRLPATNELQIVHDILDRAILLRFLHWVSTQPDKSLALPHDAAATSSRDNLSLFSPFAHFRQIADIIDMRNPADDFKLARRMRRKIIMHVGPTNSGKTYNALLALVNATTGVYAGPLRLLAHEIFDRLNKGLIAPTPTADNTVKPRIRTCNLITGEEQRIVDPDAPFVSSTVEMVNTNLLYDVVVLDEIQMIGDPQRGDAWTRALLGVRARELHLCGEETAVELVRKLVAETGDELVINNYKRLSPLVTARQSLGSFKAVRKGDCVVAFSRRQLFQIKDEIEKTTGLKCAMAYGGLPPEVRTEQAQLFNDPKSGYDVMVASDAIGMGLNL